MGEPAYYDSREGVTYYRTPRLKELLTTVDTHEGEFTDEEIKALAKKFDCTEWYIRVIIEAKPFRTDPKRQQLREKCSQAGRECKRRKGKPWLPFEDAFIERNWRKMGDKALALELTRLPGNVERNVVRTRKAVRNRRNRLKLRREKGRRKHV